MGTLLSFFSRELPSGDDLARAPGCRAACLPAIREVWRRPLPHFADDASARLLCRVITTLAQAWLLEVKGIEHIGEDRDPFLLVVNHSQRPEALLVPTTLIFARGGRLIHFFADWNFLMIPVVGAAFRHSGAIIVGTKNARPRFLNVFKRLLVDPTPPHQRAAALLTAGASVGIFPEGTVNRDPACLLPGRRGAARLALRTGAQIVPAGIRFPRPRSTRRIGDLDRMTIEIGPPIRATQPPLLSPRPDDVHRLHAELMAALARLSGKAAQPPDVGGLP